MTLHNIGPENEEIKKIKKIETWSPKLPSSLISREFNESSS